MRIATNTFFWILFFTSIASVPCVSAQPAADTCGATGKPYLRTTLYFGTKRKTGSVTEGQWRSFLKNEVTTRFPDGLTVWEANGQWRNPAGTIIREKSRVLVLVREESPTLPATVAAIVDSYKKQFDQQSVLWETARVCAGF